MSPEDEFIFVLRRYNDERDLYAPNYFGGPTPTPTILPTLITPLDILRSSLSPPRVVQSSTSTSRNVQTSTPSTAPASTPTSNMRSSTPRIVPAVSTSISNVYSGYGRPPASRWTVETLPRVRILKKEGACAICLEEWRNGDVAAELPCKHEYHFECVKKWLETRATCPQCRYEMPLEGEEQVAKNVEVDDDEDDDYTDLYDSESEV